MSNKFTHTTGRRPGSAVMAALVTLAVVLVAASSLSALSGAGELAVDLGAAAAAVMVLAVLLAAVRRPPNLDVRVVAGELRVRFHGWDALWSLRHEVRIPVDHMTTARVHRPDSLWSGWWHRRLGTVIPQTIKAGWFAGPDKRELWDVRAGAEVIDLELSPPSPMSRLVLQVPDPSALALTLTTAAPTARGAEKPRKEQG
jgi:hypothetical protein